jgi:hypothetical protein
MKADVDALNRAVVYRAYYEILKAAVDEYGVLDLNAGRAVDYYAEPEERVWGAKLIDFDNDGLAELLISQGSVFYGYVGSVDGSIGICKVYGYLGKAEALLSGGWTDGAFAIDGVEVETCESGEKYLVQYTYRDANGDGDKYDSLTEYYTVKDGKGVLALTLSTETIHDNNGNDTGLIYYINGEAVGEWDYDNAAYIELGVSGGSEDVTWGLQPQSVDDVLAELERLVKD